MLEGSTIHPNIDDCIKDLEEEGYCRIPGVFPKSLMAETRDRVQAIYDSYLARLSDLVPRLNRNQPMVYNLQSKDVFFCKILLQNKTIEHILKHFLNDRWFAPLPEGAPNYILRSFLARSSNTEMPMHIDSLVPYVGPEVFVMQCAILLEDSRAENGCTQIVPRSHLSNSYAPANSREQAIDLEGDAGDLMFWDSRIWHGAGANQSEQTRWSMIATFCRWWIKQAFDIPGNLPQEIYDQLSDSERAVLGFCSVPYDDETRGIDMKRGYELLPDLVADYKAGAKQS